MQVAVPLFYLRCPRCGRTWESATAYCAVVAEVESLEFAEALLKRFHSSIRASGGRV